MAERDTAKPTHRAYSVIKRDGQMFVEADIQELNPAGKLDDKVFSRP